MEKIITESLISKICEMKESKRHLNNRIEKLGDTITYLLKKIEKLESKWTTSSLT